MKRFLLLAAPLALSACLMQPPTPVASPDAVLKAQAQPGVKGNGTLIPQPDTPPVGGLIPQPDTPPVAAAAAAAGMARNGATEETALAQSAPAAADTAIGTALVGGNGGALVNEPRAAASAAPSSEPSATPTPTSTSTPTPSPKP